jgi:hypothetical protein
MKPWRGDVRRWNARKQRTNRGVGDEAAPALAHEADARERRGLRWETEEELREKEAV